MKRTMTAKSIEIPFKAKFSHHLAERESTETIVVEIQNERGDTGYGESCPRSYVTGESVASAQDFILKISSTLKNIKSIDELKGLKKAIKVEIKNNPSAWCALELAMLDLLAKEKNVSVEELLGLPLEVKEEFSYTAVIGVSSFFKTLIKCVAYKVLGFSDFKLKLSGEKEKDIRAIWLISKFSKSIRVDANKLFKTSEEAISYLIPLRPFLWAVEEPLSHSSFLEMKKISDKLGLKIILDESFLDVEVLEEIKEMNDLFIPNVRISKMGGILNTLEAIKKLHDCNFKWILGSHVGETSLLTRASLLFAEDAFKREGGFSTHLLKYDPFFPNLILGKNAKLKNKSLIQKTGWGMIFISKGNL